MPAKAFFKVSVLAAGAAPLALSPDELQPEHPELCFSDAVASGIFVPFLLL